MSLGVEIRQEGVVRGVENKKNTDGLEVAIRVHMTYRILGILAIVVS